jgi:hypothetical protein
MIKPITMDIPHSLGLADARERLDEGIGQIAKIIPGGSIRSRRWEGDILTLAIEAVGRRIGAKLEVMETHIHAIIDLPPLAALLANNVRSQLLGVGKTLLQ